MMRKEDLQYAAGLSQNLACEMRVDLLTLFSGLTTIVTDTTIQRRALHVSAMPMTRSFQRDGEEPCVIRLCAYSADAQACVSLKFKPCCLAPSKALSSVQTRHRFVVQKEAEKSAFRMGVERFHQRALSRH